MLLAFGPFLLMIGWLIGGLIGGLIDLAAYIALFIEARVPKKARG